jgi:integrase
MAIRQRTWTWKGKQKTAWVVDYFDAKGKRRLKTFRTKREADNWRSDTKVELRRGTHVAARDGVTFAEAGKLWIEACDADGIEAATIERYRQILRLHIGPYIGTLKLHELTLPRLRAFQDELRAGGASHTLIKSVITRLSGLLSDAQERGLVPGNVVKQRKRKKGGEADSRHQRKLEIGVDIPSPAEIRAILAAATGQARALAVTAALTGLRASELRGLRWQDLDLAKAVLHIRQRADKFGTIGSPKAASSRRTIPLPPMVVNTLKEWKLGCPRRDTGKRDASGKPMMELHLVFPDADGSVKDYKSILRGLWHPLQIAAGVSIPVGNPVMAKDDDGNKVPVMGPKYTGLHCLRHFYASWCAARKEDGGLGLPLKTVQTRLGHATLAMTSDTYGHLFPSTDDAEVLAAGERALMGA